MLFFLGRVVFVFSARVWAWGFRGREGAQSGFPSCVGIVGSGFRVQESGFRAQGSGFGVQGSGFRV